MKERKLTQVKTYTFNDIDVTVKIDFYNNQISLVNSLNYQPKQYVFVERGVEFMNGWLNILEAMKSAIKEAKKEYEHELAETSKFKEESIVKFAMALEEGKKIKKTNKR